MHQHFKIFKTIYVWKSTKVQRKEKKNLKDSERKRVNCRTLLILN